MPLDLKHRSHIITDGRDRAGARAMLKAIGFTDSDLAKPIVGIANAHSTITPCNIGIGALAARAEDALRSAGAMPRYRFGSTIFLPVAISTISKSWPTESPAYRSMSVQRTPRVSSR